MNHRKRPKSAWAAVAALLLLVTAAAAEDGRPADGRPGTVELHAQGAAIGVHHARVGSEELEPLPTMTLAQPKAVPLLLSHAPAGSWVPSAAHWRASRIEAQSEALESSAAPKRRGFGRWLKKHWYVPVLVGAAVGALAFDDDDDRGEVDDD